jgi:serine/threonine protein kinase/formylglycine-generating enzyme required for sulfatase activity
MAAVPSVHPTDQTLNSYGLGKLDDASAGSVHEHLERCEDCRRRASEIAPDTFLGRVRDAQAGQSLFGGTQLNKTSAFTPPPAADTLPPGLADNPDYEIKKELGRGGMGVVYLAHNTLMGRDEVLKVMSRQIIEKPGVLDRFLREIRAVAKLRHPNIVTAYSATRIGESIVFAMEYVEGLDLSKMVKAKGPLPVAHACNFVYQSALGLQHAHEEGLVHRDIKPGNLMLSRRAEKPVVKVLDFGLAKATREEKVDGGLTSVGQALGTPDFIAPEQILDAQSADVRADIYSLGGTLYYLLTGRPPFKATSLYDLYQAHISRDADALNLVRPEVPSELAALVAKMMAKDPERRFQTPAEVAQALTFFFKKGAVPPRAAKTAVGAPVKAAEPAVRRPATNVTEPVARPIRTFEDPPSPAPVWDSLLDAKPEPMPARASERRPPHRRWPIVAAAGAGVFALLLGIIIYFQSDGKTKTLAVGTSADLTKAGITPGKPKEAVDVTPTLSSSITNSIGMKLVLIPAGEFLMGAPDSDNYARPSEKPQHLERIAQPFYLGTTEVTQGQYRAVTGENPSKFPGSDDLPVEWVSWHDALAFCKKLSEREGLVDAYRLPTEPEWEYACRAGSTTRYCFGDDEARLGEYAWFGGNSGGKPHPVGQKLPNAWGLFDMHGSLRELCSERYRGETYQENPPGSLKPPTYVSRGGCWIFPKDAPGVVRSTGRSGESPDMRGGYLGFRVARSVEKASEKPAQLTDEIGFMPLFNGKDLTGWAGPLGDFEVVDGAVRCKTNRRSTIYFNKEYADFVARVQFRLTPGANDGLAIRYPGTGDPSNSGMCEIQLLDDSALIYANWRPTWFHGSAYGLVAAKRGHLRPVGEWNNQEVTVKGYRVKVELNGVVILDADLSQVAADHTGRDRVSGFLGLCGHGQPVDYRKIEIKDLGSNAEAAAIPVTLPHDPDFVPLFNGRNLDGWKAHPSRPGDWRVANGVLVGSGPKYGCLYSDRDDYQDFHLRAEVRINAAGHGGIYFGVPLGGNWDSSYATQIGGDHGRLSVRGDLISPFRRSPIPPDRWFTYEVIAERNHVLTKVGGKIVTDFVGTKSPSSRGRITLVSASDRPTVLEFRKVEIKELNAAAKVGATGASAPPVARSANGFVPLFNGKDFANWSAWDKKGPLSLAEASKVWSVRDGVLTGSGAQSHLFSPRGDYKNFRVKAEVKINDVGNSGLYFRAPKGPGLPLGYEAQIICNLPQSKNIGALYGTNAPNPVVPRSIPRPDTWFTVEAEAIGNRIRVWIDGQQTIDWTDSKNTYTSGHFAIQVIDEQTRIQVRKFEVEELR